MISKIKIVMVGDGGVGKTSISNRYLGSGFVDVYDPTIENYFNKQIKVNGKSIDLTIIDTAGQEEYEMLRKEQLMEADGFVIVFSLTDKSPMSQINMHHSDITEIDPKSKIVLAGNKMDLKPGLTNPDVIKFYQENAIKYIPCSAKSGVGINDIIESLVSEILESTKCNVKEKKVSYLSKKSSNSSVKNKKCFIL